MAKRTKEETDRVYNKVKTAVENGAPLMDTLKKEHMTHATYKKRQKAERKPGPKNPKKKVAELSFQEITLPTATGKKTLIVITEDAGTVESVVATFIRGNV